MVPPVFYISSDRAGICRYYFDCFNTGYSLHTALEIEQGQFNAAMAVPYMGVLCCCIERCLPVPERMVVLPRVFSISANYFQKKALANSAITI